MSLASLVAAPPIPAFNSVAQAADWYRAWLFNQALPIWWDRGADGLRGGFHESLDPAGKPSTEARRARVQCRQTFTYALAGELGWQGPWREAARHGWDYFSRFYARSDGLFRRCVSDEGFVVDDDAYLYDQAFALLALAALERVDQKHADYAGQAEALLEAVKAFRHSKGGYHEAGPDRFQLNAQMHLFEAALSWCELGRVAFRPVAEEILDLLYSRLLDDGGGFLPELFDACWNARLSEGDQRVEPGHQFEWSWLLARWADFSGDGRALACAARLFRSGRLGLCPERGVAVNALDSRLKTKDNAARLWPQTEYIKAAAALDAKEDLRNGASALKSYLHTPTQGLWWDVQNAEGKFLAGPAPASSFYHVALACQALLGAAKLKTATGAPLVRP